MSLLIPLQRFHIFTSFNNAAQSKKTSWNTNKRLSVLHGLFKRCSSKRKAPIVKQSFQDLQQEKRRSVNVGDQVRRSFIRNIHAKQACLPKWDTNIHRTTVANQKNTNNEKGRLFQGLRYDFKLTQSIPTIDQPEIKQSMKDHCESSLYDHILIFFTFASDFSAIR